MNKEKKYSIKEMYYTLQGEGYYTGRPAVFCRFAGCNLWSGREEDRHDAICQFCDTHFWGTDGLNGGKYSIQELVAKVNEINLGKGNNFIVLTGGEPGLQVDFKLVEALQESGYFVAIETNGTVILPENIDWVCLSPKANTTLALEKAHELKIVHPQVGINPKDFESFDADHYYLQPMDGLESQKATQLCIAFCKENPVWSLSLQTHKFLDIL